MEMEVGQVLAGQYELVERIGSGGMGEVWRAVDRSLEREVAVKLLRPELSAVPELVERFRTEAVALAKLNHPNITSVYTIVRDGSSWYMVMEFVRGIPLDRILAKRGMLPWSEAVAIACQILAGLDHAHTFGIVHRDIKLSNLILTGEGKVKIMDFGISRILDRSRLTRLDNWVGTVEYASPEQIRGEPIDARSDLYAVGVVLYELLTGRLPFVTKTDFDQMRAHLEYKPAVPSTFSDSIPPKLDSVLLRCLEKESDSRFQTAAEFSASLLAAANISKVQDDAEGEPGWGKRLKLPAMAVRRDAATRLSLPEYSNDLFRRASIPAAGAWIRKNFFWLVAGVVCVIALAITIVELGKHKGKAVPQYERVQDVQGTVQKAPDTAKPGDDTASPSPNSSDEDLAVKPTEKPPKKSGNSSTQSSRKEWRIRR